MTNVQATPEVAHSPAMDDIVMAAAAGQHAVTRIARANMLRAICRAAYAVDQPALPMPATIRFGTERHAVHLEFDAVEHVDEWAAQLGAPTVSRDDQVTAGGRPHAYAFALATWRGFEVCLVALVPTDTRQLATVPA